MPNLDPTAKRVMYAFGRKAIAAICEMSHQATGDPWEEVEFQYKQIKRHGMTPHDLVHKPTKRDQRALNLVP